MGTWIFVRPNLYESGRANITIYNWALTASVPVDVSRVLRLRSPYEVRNVQDFFGNPVASGIYEGGSISIPMTGLSTALPQRVVPTLPKAAGPEFGVFILLKSPFWKCPLFGGARVADLTIDPTGMGYVDI